VLRQTWAELASFHWPYDPDVVQRMLPAGVTVDSFDGRAWVGLIPFEMQGVRIGPLPRMPYFGDFVEINVRTYVVDRSGRRAVWFFSLDVPRSAAVGVARTAFSLPYCWAAARHEHDGDRHRYVSRRRWPRRTAGASTDIAFTVGDEIDPDAVTDFEHFVSARWALLTTRGRRVLYGPVDHPRWPLHRVGDVEIDDGLVTAAGLPAPQGEPYGMYSPGVPVRIGWFQ
jgi:uncharacterized protein YqjF (DUF2071 family)